jgi:hypothetical protein
MYFFASLRSLIMWSKEQSVRCREHAFLPASASAPAFQPCLCRWARGYVLGAWPTIPNAYDVRFDRQFEIWLMWGDELECVEGKDEALSIERASLRAG